MEEGFMMKKNLIQSIIIILFIIALNFAVINIPQEDLNTFVHSLISSQAGH